MKSLIVSWEYIAHPVARTVYYVDGALVGDDDSGFDRLLDMVRSQEIDQVILKIGQSSSLGGASLINSFPFRERFNELRDAVREGKIVYQFD